MQAATRDAHQHRPRRHVEVGGGRDRDRDDDQRGRGVADDLAERERQHEQAEQQRVRARVADRVDEHVPELLGGAAGGDRPRDRDHRADQDHRRPADRVIGLVRREHAGDHDRAGRQQRGDERPGRRRSPAARPSRAGSRPCAARPRRAGRPGGARLRVLHEQQVRAAACSSARHSPCRSRMSPAASTVGPSCSSPPRWMASTTRSASGVIMPGKNVSPISSERGGTSTSAAPAVAVSSGSGIAYSWASVRACSDRLGGIVRAVRDGSRRSPSSRQIAIVPASSGIPTSEKEKNAKPPAAGVGRGVGDDHVDRHPGQREQAAGGRGERGGHQDERRGDASSAARARPPRARARRSRRWA